MSGTHSDIFYSKIVLLLKDSLARFLGLILMRLSEDTDTQRTSVNILPID